MGLIITDGNTQVNFTYNPVTPTFELALGTWAPGIATMRHATLGGSAPYNIVNEQITLHIHGATAEEVGENLNALALLLDQAERWASGEAVDPVLIHYNPYGSASLTGTARKAPVYGRQLSSNNPGLVVRPSASVELEQGILAAVQMSIDRGGLWVTDEDPYTWAGTGVCPPDVFSQTLADWKIPSPMSIKIGPFYYPNSLYITKGFLMVASAAQRIAPLEAYHLAVGESSFTNENDASKNPYGSQILRYTAQNTGAEEQSGLYIITSLFSQSAKRVDIFATVRNNSLSHAFTVRLVARSYGAIISTRGTVIDTSDQDPRPVFLGSIVTANGIQTIQLSVKPDQPDSTETQSLDIDCIVLLARDDDTSRVLAVVNDVLLSSLGTGTAVWLTESDRYTVGGAPLFAAATENESDFILADYRGDSFLLHKGTELEVCWLATGDPLGGASGKWRPTNYLGVTPALQLWVRRRLGYITPF